MLLEEGEDVETLIGRMCGQNNRIVLNGGEGQSPLALSTETNFSIFSLSDPTRNIVDDNPPLGWNSLNFGDPVDTSSYFQQTPLSHDFCFSNTSSQVPMTFENQYLQYSSEATPLINSASYLSGDSLPMNCTSQDIPMPGSDSFPPISNGMCDFLQPTDVSVNGNIQHSFLHPDNFSYYLSGASG